MYSLNKEVVSIIQGIVVISMLLIGTSLIYSLGLESKQDFWLAIMVAIAYTIPLAFICGRLHNIFPGKDLYQILEVCFGKYFGKFISFLFIFYFFVNGSEILRNFGQFVNTVSLNATPQLLIFLVMMLFAVWGVKQGVEVITRVSEVFFILIIVTFFIVMLLLTPSMHINNLLLVLAKGMKPVFSAAFSIMTYPFAEIFIFLCFFDKFTEKKSYYKLYLYGLLISGALIFFISLLDVLVLGVDMTSAVYYPTYTAFRRVDLGNLLQRLDIVLGALDKSRAIPRGKFIHMENLAKAA